MIFKSHKILHMLNNSHIHWRNRSIKTRTQVKDEDKSEVVQQNPGDQSNQELTERSRKANNHVDDFYKYPQRNRKPPVKLKDYVVRQLISD